MAIKTLYTAVGRFERRTNGCNRSCPIILLGGQEYMADMQEMVIWSISIHQRSDCMPMSDSKADRPNFLASG